MNEAIRTLPGDMLSIIRPIINADPVAVSMLAIKINDTVLTDKSKWSLIVGKAIFMADKSIKTIRAAIFMAIIKFLFIFIVCLFGSKIDICL